MFQFAFITPNPPKLDEQWTHIELSYLWDELVVIGQVCPAVDAAVSAVAGWQVSLEGFGLGHLHHVSGAGLLAGVRAGTGRVAALLDLLTEETLEDASKSRRCCGVGVWHAPHRHHRRNSNLWGKRKRESRWETYSILLFIEPMVLITFPIWAQLICWSNHLITIIYYVITITCCWLSALLCSDVTLILLQIKPLFMWCIIAYWWPTDVKGQFWLNSTSILLV